MHPGAPSRARSRGRAQRRDDRLAGAFRAVDRREVVVARVLARPAVLRLPAARVVFDFVLRAAATFFAFGFAVFFRLAAARPLFALVFAVFLLALAADFALDAVRALPFRAGARCAIAKRTCDPIV